jgi:hypothetical protein
MWEFGPHNSIHFLKNQTREFLFREAVIAFMGAGDKSSTDSPEDAYCRSCKQANKTVDCSKCDRKIEVKEDGKLANKRTD